MDSARSAPRIARAPHEAVAAQEGRYVLVQTWCAAAGGVGGITGRV